MNTPILRMSDLPRMGQSDPPGAVGGPPRRAPRVSLRPGLDHQVERRSRRPPHAREARFLEHAAETRLTRLSAEREPHLLRERSRRADERRDGVEETADRVQ